MSRPLKCSLLKIVIVHCTHSTLLHLSFVLYVTIMLFVEIIKLSLSISFYLNLSLSLRDRKRVETIITFDHHPHHSKLFKDLRVDLYSSVIHHWNHLLKPILFLPCKHRVNWCHYSSPLSAIGLRDVYLVVDFC